MQTFHRKIALAVAALCALTFAGQASADLLLDRGLPTANLNNAAGANRSNVSWTFTDYSSDSYWLVGDTFTNNTTQNWQINNIRLWTVGQTDTAELRGGLAGGTIGMISPATYGTAVNYQGSSGSMIDMSQVDFAVSILLAPGQIFSFFLDGAGSANSNPDPLIVTSVPYVHASNAALSGSPQDGSDDSMLYVWVDNGVVDSSSVGAWTSLGNGWDKPSDVNVQVFGNAVPEPGSLALLGLALGGLAIASRRKTAK